MVDQPCDIGDYVSATLVRRVAGGLWEADSDSVPSGWVIRYRPRHDDSPAAVDEGRFRVYQTAPERAEILLTASDFGFLPISDRMRPRYRNAARAMATWLENGLGAMAEPNAEFPVYVSEMKGMLNRCLRKDQWDWFEVWSGLGRPSMSDMRALSAELTSLRSQLDDSAAVDRTSRRLEGLGMAPRLRRFLSQLEASYAGLAGGREETANSEPHVTASRGEGRTTTQLIDKSKLEHANREHRRTLTILTEALDEMGYYPEANTFIDLFVRLRSGPAIFEVKSVRQGNELSQVRHAISQLYEYRYRHQYPDATLWLVLSQEPATPWLPAYLVRDRRIELLWIADGKIAGPSREALADGGFSGCPNES